MYTADAPCWYEREGNITGDTPWAMPIDAWVICRACPANGAMETHGHKVDPPGIAQGQQGHKMGTLSHCHGIRAWGYAGWECCWCQEPGEQGCSSIWFQGQWPDAGGSMLAQLPRQ